MKKNGYKYLDGKNNDAISKESKNLKNNVKDLVLSGNIYEPLAHANWEGAKTHIPINFVKYPGIKIESFYWEMEPGIKGTKHIHPIADELYLILEGQGQLYLEDKVFDLKKGDVFHIVAGQWHAIETLESTEKIKVFIVLAPPLPFFIRENGYCSFTEEAWDKMGYDR